MSAVVGFLLGVAAGVVGTLCGVIVWIVEERGGR